MALVEERTEWVDGEGTSHILTLEARDTGYVVRHELNIRGGSSASWELNYDDLDEARHAFTADQA